MKEQGPMSIVLEAAPETDHVGETSPRPAPVSRVLYVDPSDQYRSQIEDILDYDFAVGLDHVETAHEAMERLQNEEPILVLCEIHLGDSSGFDFVQELRSKGSSIPVVLLAERGCEDSALQTFSVGASGYLPKRYLESKLGPTLQSILASLKKQRALSQMVVRLKRYDAQFECENNASLVPHLIEFIQERMGQLNLCDEESKWTVGIALEEALLNAMYHGNLELSSDLKQDGSNRFYEEAQRRMHVEPFAKRKVHVDVHLDRHRARIVIRDEGPGFDITKLADCTSEEGMERSSGRGILMIRSFMDEVLYNSKGNEITLIKKK
jgi:DNA-binding NarL/FixJ family response regulator/anti-sigma regulatory factor (Ser/Thr protein kinase)